MPSYIRITVLVIRSRSACMRIKSISGMMGEMPEDLDSTDKLFMKHSSKPYNPKLANVFFMSGMIEAWGRGFDKIKEACARYDGPLPEYNISKSGVMVLCKACDRYLELLSGGKENSNSVSETKNETSFETKMKQVLKPKEYKKLEPIIEKLATQETVSIQEVMELTKKSRTTAWRYMQILIDCNVVEVSGNTNNVSYKRLK